jgi:VanZ family protein
VAAAAEAAIMDAYKERGWTDNKQELTSSVEAMHPGGLNYYCQTTMPGRDSGGNTWVVCMVIF